MCGCGESVGADERSDALARDGTCNVALFEQVEHQHRHLIVHTETESGRIGHLELLLQRLAVRDLAVEGRVRVLARSALYTPSTALAIRTTSALISRARWAAVVSVEKYGMPMPAPKITTRPFSRCRWARSGRYGSATCPMVIAVCTGC